MEAYKSSRGQRDLAGAWRGYGGPWRNSGYRSFCEPLLGPCLTLSRCLPRPPHPSHSTPVFETLYLVITYGHETAELAAKIDPPDDYYRIR